MICFPNSKINLGLNIVGRRPDGFHNIESIFVPLCLADIMEVVIAPAGRAPSVKVNLSGIFPDIDPENTSVYQAWELIHGVFKVPPVQIALHKMIPSGAGLGGGSSDSAFMILALNELFDLDLTQKQLLHYMGIMGSDCSFFYYNRPGFMSGVGDIARPIELDLSGYFVYLVVPDVRISTPEAYAMVEPETPSFSLEKIASVPPDQWKEVVVNDFEKVLSKAFPILGALKKEMYASGAFYSSLTGSGSGVFGLFESRPSENSFFKPYYSWIGHVGTWPKH